MLVLNIKCGKIILEFERRGEIQEPESRFFYFFNKLIPCKAPGLNSIFFKNKTGNILIEIDYDLRNMYLVYDRFWLKKIRTREEYDKESEMFTRIAEKYLRLPGFKAILWFDNIMGWVRRVPLLESQLEEIKALKPIDSIKNKNVN